MDNSTLLNHSISNATDLTVGLYYGHYFASLCLFLMAIVPIYVGSIRSTKEVSQDSLELVSGKDAALFPFLASGALFAIYIVFKFVPMHYINMLIKFHFSVMGTVAMCRVFSPIFHPYFPGFLTNYLYEFTYSKKLVDQSASPSSLKLIENFDIKFESKDFIGSILAIALGAWYFFSGHWIANNFVALTLAILAIELIRLNKFKNGFLLLCGLFIYDIFWVFGTQVMVTVAKTLDAPIKVTFPRDFLIHGIFGKQFGLLGLGDIVVPGLFIAMLLRFDLKLNRQGSRIYFLTGYIAYIFGIVTTFIVMYISEHPQPALLYLVPACLGAPLFLAFVQSDIGLMFGYSDMPEPKLITSSDATNLETENANTNKIKKLD